VMVAAEQAEDARLEHVRVLVLVDQHVLIEAADAIADSARGVEERAPEEQQVVVVDEVPFALALRVVGKDAGGRCRPRTR
jgi:hypothetical protein